MEDVADLQPVTMTRICILFCVTFLLPVAAELKLKSSFGAGQDFPFDNRGDEDNVSPPLSWTGVPKNAESFVLIVDSEPPTGADRKGKGDKVRTHWLLYDIPKEVKELREELSGAGASDVARLGMKEDAGQAPVVRRCAPRHHVRTWRGQPLPQIRSHCTRSSTRWVPSMAGWTLRSKICKK